MDRDWRLLLREAAEIGIRDGGLLRSGVEAAGCCCDRRLRSGFEAAGCCCDRRRLAAEIGSPRRRAAAATGGVWRLRSGVRGGGLRDGEYTATNPTRWRAVGLWLLETLERLEYSTIVRK